MAERRRGKPARRPGSGLREAAGHDLCPFCGSPTAGEMAIRLSASRNRQLQVTRQSGRKLFGKERKELFLQWFAATGNLGFAASQAGVCRQTISKHRMNDPVFEAGYRDAVMLCVPDLQARLHSYVQGQPRLDAAGGLAPPDEGAFDPQLAIQILRELQRHHAAMAFPPPERHLLRARDLADARYAEPIGVDDMAAAAGLSKAHFSREFRKAFGETPRAYLLTRRLERAAALLRTTERSVAEVCLDVGLASVGSFTTSFTRTFGLTPTAYRAGATIAPVPSCIVRRYARPQRRTFREDRAAPPT